jgi:serpin B
MTKKAMGVWILAAVILFGSVLLAGCMDPMVQDSSPAFPSPVTAVPGDTSGPVSAVNITEYERCVADANNRFAFDLYETLSKDPDSTGCNLFFSPFSLSSAMAITFEGARGKTAEEIRTVFHFPADSATLRQGFSLINAGINRNDSAVTLRSANALWAEQTSPFLPGYVDIAEQYYNAKTTNLDFIGQPDPSRITINQWVEKQTDEKIKDLVPPGSIDPLTRLVITNAIYFKGDWENRFDRNKTADADFRTASGKTVRVPMMQSTENDAVYLYAENEDLQMLSMPYNHNDGKKISMVVILPRDDDPGAGGSSLDRETLAALKQSATSRRVMVYFPKFTLDSKRSLSVMLKGMGMPAAFTDAADLSGMDGMRDLFISDVFHQAVIEVNEEGTVAAAATAVIAGGSASPAEPVPVFIADHPFIFIIQDDRNDMILFMGRVVDLPGS